MKVVAMLECGLPVLANRFKFIEELVQVSKAVLFNDANELAKSLFALLSTPRGPNSRRLMSDYIVETFSSPAMRWPESWKRNAM
jgi:hypothetical protein